MANSTINIFGSSGEAMVGADTINTILASMDSKLTSDDINIETLGDGTVDVDVKNDTYTINLNHTHEGMAKLVVDTTANLPDASEMESDTIYGELDDGEIATIYLGGYPFYGGGGGASSVPVLRRPADGTTIDMGQTTNGTVSKTINVKGKSLTQALTIELDGTGYSFGTTQPSGVTRDSSTQLTVTAAAANALNGVDIVVVYTGNDTDEDASGTLGITSTAPDSISTEATLIANKVTYEDLAGVKLTGTQWMQTDYYPNANTEFVLRCKLEANAATVDTNHGNDNLWSCTPGSSNKKFYIVQMGATSSVPTNPYGFTICNENKMNDVGSYQTVGTISSTKQNFLADPLRVFYTKGTTRGTFGISADDGTGILTHETVLKTTTMENALKIGINGAGDKIYSIFNLIIYSLVFTEGGNEVRHWVAKKKNGVPGLYDTITGSFISSETSTELVPVTNS